MAQFYSNFKCHHLFEGVHCLKTSLTLSRPGLHLYMTSRYLWWGKGIWTESRAFHHFRDTMLGCRMLWKNRPQIALFRLFAMDIPDKISQAQSLPISNIPQAKHLVKLKRTTRLNPHSARLIVSQVPPTNLGECQKCTTRARPAELSCWQRNPTRNTAWILHHNSNDSPVWKTANKANIYI